MKVSKYLVRKNKTGSLNKPTNYTSLVKEKVEVEEIKRKEFSYENFENDFEYINDLYYATIENNFYYFSLPGDDPLIWNSNNVMREKYINNEIVEVDRAYQKKFEKFVSQNPANASVNEMDINGLKEIFCPKLRTS